MLSAKTGKETWEILRQKEIDAILLDEDIADTSGEKFFKEAGVRYPGSIGIFMSESRNDQTIMEIFKAGAVYQSIPNPCPPSTFGC